MQFDDRLLVEMLRRSYLACDGLWFVKAEEHYGLAAAFELDAAVWQVMAKLQARKARELLGADGPPLSDLARCYALKLTAEGYGFAIDQSADEATITVVSCPWRQALVRAQRTHLGPEIARRICTSEGQGWAREFGPDISFDLTTSMCAGHEACCLVFRHS